MTFKLLTHLQINLKQRRHCKEGLETLVRWPLTPFSGVSVVIYSPTKKLTEEGLGTKFCDFTAKLRPK